MRGVMVRKPQTRVAGEGTVYQEANGRWRAVLTVVTDDGRRVRRKRTAPTKALARDVLREMIRDRDAGVLGAKAAPTLAAWLEHWLTEIAPARCSEGTLDGYESAIRMWIAPAKPRKSGWAGIGRIPLDKLRPEHCRAVYKAMREEGRSGSTQHQVHSILRRALGVAQAEGKVTRNVAALVDGPGLEREEVEPLTRDEARRILQAAQQRPRNGARWPMALAMALRQGEALALSWDDVHLPPKGSEEDGTLTVAAQLKRRRTRHGCGPRKADGAWPCRRKQPAKCPARSRDAGMYLKRPKTKASASTIPLLVEVVEELRQHKAAQARERLQEGSSWLGWVDPDSRRPVDLVFCQRSGRPIDPRRDYQDWKDLLVEAGVDEARLHDARHTAATTLLEMGVDVRVVSEFLRHSSPTITRSTYQHVAPELARDAATRMGAALYAKGDGPGGSGSGSSSGSSRRGHRRPAADTPGTVTAL